MILISFENLSVSQSWVQSDCESTPPTCQDEEVRGVPGGGGEEENTEMREKKEEEKYKNTKAH